ncbi:MAG: RDD family protein [Magnetococcales bacterium]|nr:RDD family protein [Magnetococcales bacterium]
MFCARCRAELPGGSVFCSQCGERVASPDSAQAAASTATDHLADASTTSITLSPPTGRAFSHAGFWVRVAASFYDQLILIIPSLIVGAIAGFLFGAVMRDRAGLDMLGSLIGWIVGWVYFANMESSRQQASLGKMLVKIKVVDLDGNPVSFSKASGRYFGKIVSTLALFVGFLMVGWTEKKQGLHDKMADCLVINRDDISGRTKWVVIGLVGMLLLPALGIAMAVGIPALQATQAQAQVTETLAQLQAAEGPLTEWYTGHGYWPSQGSEIPPIPLGKYAATIVFGQSGPTATAPELTITARLKSQQDVVPGIAGRTMRIWTNDGGKSWECGPGAFNGVDHAYLPNTCR